LLVNYGNFNKTTFPRSHWKFANHQIS